MINLNLIKTKDAYYDNKIHYDKKYLMRMNNSSKIVLKEHEFNFLKMNIKIIIAQVIEIINKTKNNPNLCFESVYNFFESFMPDFLDGFFGMVFDAHILKTNSRFFDKEYFLKNIRKATKSWPNKYNEDVLSKCVYEDFPKYVLWKNNTISEYLFIRSGWMFMLLQFLKTFKKSGMGKEYDLEDKAFLLDQVKKQHYSITSASLNWTDYEMFEKVFYAYCKKLLEGPDGWGHCTI